ncbi:MAG: hypothetical protein CUN49_07335 [Candidatus Thermofonsia Clade 1 bacterium]|jgi:hypothetical protein|uniref:Uncharacterized protein n=1 Tax=Candidatus Thermofonsia Clade 1 bacterium TaxID=2364210 RepID=A0A2M8PEW3_9CHLR|nr:MAG: hypothetical protein CUN49_07335 [Candidatus Thermofonsia Clade 1 bacterium]RMF52007.1 MAG: hypothetical protein D6749_06180 [Chloroflexota bacterium]
MLYPDTLRDEALLEMHSHTSPWTELFQDETADRASEAAFSASYDAAEEERPTHEALSAIFQG